jgi:hypothetical protein
MGPPPTMVFPFISQTEAWPLAETRATLEIAVWSLHGVVCEKSPLG